MQDYFGRYFERSEGLSLFAQHRLAQAGFDRRREEAGHLPRTISADVSNAPDPTMLKTLVHLALSKGLAGEDFLTRLGQESGYVDEISAWSTDGKVPSGLVRQVVWNRAEIILRQQDAWFLI